MMDNNTTQGVPIEILIKIRPTQEMRSDLKVYENKISLLDQYDRAVDEFITNSEILEGEDSIRTSFDRTIGKYIGFVVHGVNLTLFTFGANQSGKTLSLFGDESHSGALSLIVETLFAHLDNKYSSIKEDMTQLNVPEAEATTYSYNVSVKYVEIRDETIVDLLQKFNYYKQPAQLFYSEYDGYTIQGAASVGLANSMSFPDIIGEAIKYRTPFEYSKPTKNTGFISIEVEQTLESRATRDVKKVKSRINVFDLPSAEILSDHFRNLSNNLEYKTLYAFQNMIGDLAKSNGNSIPTIYENSVVTKLMKEFIGANSICMGIFTLCNSQYSISNITFKMMKLCSRIECFPVLNDINSINLLKKFRTDIAYYSKFKNGPGFELKPPIIPPSLNETAHQVNNQPLPMQIENPVNAGRIAFLEKENLRLQQALNESEEEKQNLLRTIATLRNNQTHVNVTNPVPYNAGMPPYMGDKYDVSDKLLHIEDDINEVNEIMNVVNKLNEKFKALEEERRVLAEEVETLRSTNQTLTNEINRIQQEGNSNQANFSNEIHNLKELLNSTKNELDYMRNEAEKYRKIQADLLLEIDEREVQYKKQLEDKEREIEMKMADISQNEKRALEKRMREDARKIEHYGEENTEMNKAIQELKNENRRLNLKLEEMVNTYRQYFQELPDRLEDDDEDEDKFSPKEKMLKLFTDRENELKEDLKLEKSKTENLREQLKKMRTYARKARNMALDYFPPNEEMPEMLTKDLNTFFEDAENESVIQFLEFEIRSLRERNKKLEYENTRIKEEYRMTIGGNNPLPSITIQKDQSIGGASTVPGETPIPNGENISERDIQKKILEEINKLKMGNTGGGNNGMNQGIINSQNQEIERLKTENMRLSEENKRLKTIINDNAINDINSTNEASNPKAMRMKINFLQKSIEQLEKERTELSMRCTMAEEQLKNFQEMFNSTTQGYQKKILELNKRLEAANIKLNQNYNGGSLDDL